MPGRCACTVQFTEKTLQKRLTKGGAAGIITHVAGHKLNMWGISSAGRALAWHARGQRFDPAILHQKSTVLRRKYGAFLFAEAEGAALLRLQRFRPSDTPKKICCPGADRAKAKPRKALGAASLIYVYGSVRCGCRDTPPMRHTRRATDGSRPAGRIRRSGRRSRRPAPPRGSGRCSPFPVRWPRGRR